MLDYILNIWIVASSPDSFTKVSRGQGTTHSLHPTEHLEDIKDLNTNFLS